MKKAAYIFPGQGSQIVGMGEDLYQNYKKARAVFETANRTLGFPISELCFQGPEKDLKKTVHAQPALLTMSLACLEAVYEVQEETGKELLPKADYMAGHSLGEYSALAAAGAVDYAEAVKIASERGSMMYEIGQEVPGAMLAIIGMAVEDVQEICEQTGVWIANYNCPGQIIVSGRDDDIIEVKKLAKQKGAKLVLPLQVSGAFHCPLMGAAVAELNQIIWKTDWKDPVVPVIGNTHAQEIRTRTDIKEELREQLCNSVQWENTLRYLESQGVNTFVEIGPGNVLTGLVKRTCPNAETIQIGSVEDIYKLLEACS